MIDAPSFIESINVKDRHASQLHVALTSKSSCLAMATACLMHCTVNSDDSRCIPTGELSSLATSRMTKIQAKNLSFSSVAFPRRQKKSRLKFYLSYSSQIISDAFRFLCVGWLVPKEYYITHYDCDETCVYFCCYRLYVMFALNLTGREPRDYVLLHYELSLTLFYGLD